MQALSSLFRDKQLIPNWSYSCVHTFWRLKTSLDGFIVGEDRNTLQKTVSFFCINEKTGEVLWKNRVFDEKWWLSFEIIYDGVIFFHEYSSPDLPEPKKIIAVDIHTGNILWENPDYKLLFAYSGNAYVLKQGYVNQFFELDITSGTIERDLGFDVSYVSSLQNLAEKQQTGTNVFLPEYIEKKIFFQEKEYQLILKKLNFEKVTGIIEQYRNAKYVALSFYENMNPNSFENDLIQRLYIFKTERTSYKKVFEEILIQHATTAIANAFFIKHEMLYFVKEKKILSAISLAD
jgi:hypothetical protein